MRNEKGEIRINNQISGLSHWMGGGSKYQAREQKRRVGEEILSLLLDMLNSRYMGDISRGQSNLCTKIKINSSS